MTIPDWIHNLRPIKAPAERRPQHRAPPRTDLGFAEPVTVDTTDGKVVAASSDQRHVFLATSSDHGQSWSVPVPVNVNEPGPGCWLLVFADDRPAR